MKDSGSRDMSFNIGGRLLEFTRPLVMGILNVTPDSFYAGSRVTAAECAARAGEMLGDGADILDIGGFSTRPGAAEVSEAEELDRLLPALEGIRAEYPEAVISVDTFRGNVARRCIDCGADIINDIGGGTLDDGIWEAAAETGAPYILMHTRGTPATMSSLTDYDDIVADVLSDLAFKTDRLRRLGVCDVIVDPGFGFAKDVDQNFRLLGQLALFRGLGCPILAGLSRKTMIWRELGITPAEALNGTTALNMTALLNGADILRVHDVKAAAETVRLYEAYHRNLPDRTNTVTTEYFNHFPLDS